MNTLFYVHSEDVEIRALEVFTVTLVLLVGGLTELEMVDDSVSFFCGRSRHRCD